MEKGTGQWLRLGAGLYLLYLCSGLIEDVIGGQVFSLPVVGGAILVFGAAGLVLVTGASKYLYQSRRRQQKGE